MIIDETIQIEKSLKEVLISQEELLDFIESYMFLENEYITIANEEFRDKLLEICNGDKWQKYLKYMKN